MTTSLAGPDGEAERDAFKIDYQEKKLQFKS